MRPSCQNLDMTEFSLERDLVRPAPTTVGGDGDFRRRTPDRGAGTRTQAQIDRSMHRMFGGVTPEHALAHEHVAAENREVQGKGFFGRMGTRIKQGLLGLGFGKLFGRKRPADDEAKEKKVEPTGQKMGWMERLFGAKKGPSRLPFSASVGRRQGWADALVDADQGGGLAGRPEGSNWFDQQASVSEGSDLEPKSKSEKSYTPSHHSKDDHGEDLPHLNEIPQHDLFKQGEFEGGGFQFADHSSHALSDSSDEDDAEQEDNGQFQNFMFNHFMANMTKYGKNS